MPIQTPHRGPLQHAVKQDMPCVGPHKGRDRPMCWRISCDPGFDLPGDDEGPPGSRYTVTFTPGQVKRLTWEKIDEKPEPPKDTGVYQLLGSWSEFEPVDMSSDPSRPGLYFAEAQCSGSSMQFHFLRNEDHSQNICPVVEGRGYGSLYSAVAPVGHQSPGRYWNIDAEDGEVYRIELYRSPEDFSDLSVSWHKVSGK
ncbi:unnamed protein product [Symbiodinium natans]|uniref:Uncharacterized protein n=1 Tax=Symbiodinium natans TaxID=878477 RepID=A0A812PJR7_9DINO|nr:unnamed protein product [Symbiodinium natans]